MEIPGCWHTSDVYKLFDIKSKDKAKVRKIANPDGYCNKMEMIEFLKMKQILPKTISIKLAGFSDNSEEFSDHEIDFMQFGIYKNGELIEKLRMPFKIMLGYDLPVNPFVFFK